MYTYAHINNLFYSTVKLNKLHYSKIQTAYSIEQISCEDISHIENMAAYCFMRAKERQNDTIHFYT